MRITKTIKIKDIPANTVFSGYTNSLHAKGHSRCLFVKHDSGDVVCISHPFLWSYLYYLSTKDAGSYEVRAGWNDNVEIHEYLPRCRFADIYDFIWDRIAEK